jgi:hypothetical protein
MATLTASPFSLAFDTLVEVRITATNIIGTGSTSVVNTSGAKIRRAPGTMGVVTKTSGDETQMVISWTALSSATDIGNSAILAYNLYWDTGAGTSATTSLYEGLTTSYTLTGLTSGRNYKFKIRARNVYGYGSFSTEVTLQASTLPGTVTTITTQYGTYPNVEIVWSPPASNGGTAITKYQILIWNPTTSTYVEDMSYCDGSTATVFNNLKCSFTVNYLMSAYTYTRGTLFRAMVRAFNANGWGSYSNANLDGATIKTTPTRMNTPVEDPSTSSSQIVITWSPITSTEDIGGDTIIYYSLEWNQGSVTNVWQELTTPNVLVTSYTMTSGFTPGVSYTFRVRAKNSIGLGVYSFTIVVTPASIPSKMATAATSTVSTSVRIAWDLPNLNGGTIVSYRVWIMKKDGTYNLESTWCSESDSLMTTNRYCLVRMTDLTGATYNLVRSDLVRVKVQASNAKGWGDLSDVNTVGATVETLPD